MQAHIFQNIWVSLFLICWWWLMFGRLGLQFRHDFSFFITSRKVSLPSQPLVQWIPGGGGVSTPEQSSRNVTFTSSVVEVMNLWSCNSFPPYAIMAWRLNTGTSLHSPFYLTALFRIHTLDDNFKCWLGKGLKEAEVAPFDDGFSFTAFERRDWGWYRRLW
jgi:hypothetical protein